MKIGLLTIHHAYNYGAALQAYATYSVLTNMGYNVEFIDYDNQTFQEERKLFLKFNSIGNLFRNFRVFLRLSQNKERIEKYEEFFARSHKSQRQWINECDFSSGDYDVIITGSDQTFCLYLTDKPDEMRPYFLESVGRAKRLSYGASMGEKFEMLTKKDELWLKERFEKFDCITVREKRSADYIEKLIGSRPEVVLDPTLLIAKEQWNELSSDLSGINGEYIAFYTVLSDAWVIDYVKQLANKLGLRVVALHAQTRYELRTQYEFINDAGPQEFISIIKNARYVVTTSFHASVFSIIFKKQFVSLIVGEGNRLNSLLSSLGLAERAIRGMGSEALDKITETIDYDSVTETLNSMKEHSMKCLKDSIEKVL